MGLAKKLVKPVVDKIIKQIVAQVLAIVTDLIQMVTDAIMAQTSGIVAMIPAEVKFEALTDTGAAERDEDSLSKEIMIGLSSIKGSKSDDDTYDDETGIIIPIPLSSIPLLTNQYANEDDGYVDPRRVIATRVITQQQARHKAIESNPEIEAAKKKVTGEVKKAWEGLRDYCITLFDTMKKQCSKDSLKQMNPLNDFKDLPEAFAGVGKSFPAAVSSVTKGAILGITATKQIIKTLTLATSETAAMAGNPFTSSAAPGYMAKELLQLMEQLNNFMEQKDNLVDEFEEAIKPLDEMVAALNKMTKALNTPSMQILISLSPMGPTMTATIDTITASIESLSQLLKTSITTMTTTVSASMALLGGFTPDVNVGSDPAIDNANAEQRNAYVAAIEDAQAEVNELNEKIKPIQDQIDANNAKITEYQKNPNASGIGAVGIDPTTEIAILQDENKELEQKLKPLQAKLNKVIKRLNNMKAELESLDDIH